MASTDSSERKAEVRRDVIARILAMGLDDRRGQEAALVDRLERLPGFAEADSVLLYATAFPEEVDTRPMLRRSLDLGKRLVLPRVERSTRMLRLLEVADLGLDLVAGRMGIPEPRAGCPVVSPDSVDWALVPGLAFDGSGNRLGRGGGYYDRLLPTLRPSIPCWALILDAQWVEDLPIEAHDQPLGGVADWRRSVAGGRLSE